MMKLRVFTTGGTIDKIYFDQKSEYQVGAPQVLDIFRSGNVAFDFEVESLLRKDSLEISEEDRALIRERVANDSHEHIIITHGTDTMIRTAQALAGIPNKVIVLTGSLEPARFKGSDAEFNIGCAVGAVQALRPGVYIAMNGRVFHADQVKKDPAMNCFTEL